MLTKEWYPADPHEAAAWLRNADAVWWIAGGWAIDLFLGRVNRGHADVDVGMLTRDAPAVVDALTSWEFFKTKDGKLTMLKTGTPPRHDVHSLWGRRVGSKDFRSAVPKLSVAAREWLRDSLAISQPRHRWIAELGA